MKRDKNNFKKVIMKLESVEFLKKNIEYIDKKIKMIDSDLAKIKISEFEERKGGGGKGNRIEKLLDEKTKLNDKLNDLKLEKKFIMESVNTLEGIEREVIIDFYFKKINIFKISSNKNYSDRYIRKIRNNAISKLSVYLA